MGNTSADPSSIQGRWHFGIPIYDKHLPAFSEHQVELITCLHRLREKDRGSVRSNQGGWHSSDDLHLKEDRLLNGIMVSLLQVASACIKDFEGEREFKDIRMVAAWANMNEKGDWNAPHEHMPCTWSGVFYVDAGDAAGSDKGDLGGQILFFDPLPMGREWKRPPNVSYQPVTGTLLLFPSFLTHMVAPYKGDRPRISIAFNLVVDR